MNPEEFNAGLLQAKAKAEKRYESLAYEHTLLRDNYDELDRRHEQLKKDIWLTISELRVAARGADEQGHTDWAMQLRAWADQLEAARTGKPAPTCGAGCEGR